MLELDGVAAMADTAIPRQALPWTDTSLPSELRAAMVVAAMTQAEKFAWLSATQALPNGDPASTDGAIGSAGCRAQSQSRSR